ncbi:MAG: hypothetical protein ACAI44_34365, partial [Candidatus Sericytochromatia bacterium]
GQEILPLYPSLPAVVADKPGFYALLALCDAVRIGRAREVNLAREELTQRILHQAPLHPEAMAVFRDSYMVEFLELP